MVTCCYIMNAVWWKCWMIVEHGDGGAYNGISYYNSKKRKKNRNGDLNLKSTRVVRFEALMMMIGRYVTFVKRSKGGYDWCLKRWPWIVVGRSCVPCPIFSAMLFFFFSPLTSREDLRAIAVTHLARIRLRTASHLVNVTNWLYLVAAMAMAMRRRWWWWW